MYREQDCRKYISKYSGRLIIRKPQDQKNNFSENTEAKETLLRKRLPER